jgi:putative membrane protein insertion efficiency factor
MKKFWQNFNGLNKMAVLLAIRFYQKTLSFDHGPLAKYVPFWGCRFYPSCSEYAYQAVAKYGVLRGCLLGLKRISRCHPLSPGGYDPVP